MASAQLTKEFKETVFDEYGIELSNKDAKRMLENLVSYFDLLAYIHHREVTSQDNPDLRGNQ